MGGRSVAFFFGFIIRHTSWLGGTNKKNVELHPGVAACVVTRLDVCCHAVAASPAWCRQRQSASKQQVLGSARVFLCTIASTSRMIREFEEITSETLKVHTVIVDECGCTP